MIGEFSDAFGKSFPDLVVCCTISRMSCRDKCVIGTHFLGHIKTQFQVADRILTHRFGAYHIVIRIGIVFRTVAADLNPVFVSEFFDLVYLTVFQIWCIGVRPAAPEFDVVITESFRIHEDVFDIVALITACEHSKFHRFSSSITHGSNTSTTLLATFAPVIRHSGISSPLRMPYRNPAIKLSPAPTVFTTSLAGIICPS